MAVRVSVDKGVLQCVCTVGRFFFCAWWSGYGRQIFNFPAALAAGRGRAGRRDAAAGRDAGRLGR
ncbi:hypothetical protein CQA65_24985, partial [Klebsiella pneumoniae]